MTRILIITGILVFCFNVAVSQKYPVLTSVITFDGLARKASSREVEWTNPNGIHEKMHITEMAIPVDAKMKQSLRNFMQFNYGLDSIWLKPEIIVFHAMGNGDIKNSLEVSSFLNDRIPESWGDLSRAGTLPNGAHFIIDKNGDIICLAPPFSLDGTQISYGRNHHQWIIKRHQDANPFAFGIENVTDQNDYVHLTTEQIESNAQLARWLIWMENNKIKFLTSHHQFDDDKNYDSFLTSFKLRNLQKKYRTRGRKDIGDKNLQEIIEKVNRYGYSTSSFFDLK